MRLGRRTMTLMRAILLLLTCTALVSGCRDTKPAAATPPPAKVENAVKEGELSAVKLTPEAETRVGIKVTAVANGNVVDTTTVAGEVLVPPGMSLDVAAPVAGTLAAPQAGPPTAGRRVHRGDTLFRIVPLLPAERDLRINAQRDVTAAAATVDAARKKLARAEQLLADGSGSRRAVEEARAELGGAEAAVKAAEERLSVVGRSPINQANELVVSAPSDGVIETVDAAPGQSVAASARLLRISRLDRLWIKVPIYAGHRRAIDLGRGAEVLRLDDPPDAPGLPARPVTAPPTANPNASSVDVVFELIAPGDLTPGERVLVRLSGRGAGSAVPMIPESALIHDIHGGTWVYEQTAPHVFARRRVEVRDTSAGMAVLVRGLKPGALVVTTGAAELYGVEFGAGK
jgi:membrane fusion protein, heavy metal efflux system